MEQALIKLDGIHEILSANEGLTARAKAMVMPKLEEFNKLDLSKLTSDLGDKYEVELNELLNKVEKSYELNMGRRKPFTQKMDEVKKIFTADEAELKSLSDEIKEWMTKWNKEKLNRNRAEEDSKNAKLAKDNAKIDYRKHVTEQINIRYLEMVSKLKQRMIDKFYSLSGEELEAYKKQLESYKPAMVIPDYGTNDNALLNEDEMKEIRTKTELDIFNALKEDFSEQMESCKQSLFLGQDKTQLEQKAAIEAQHAKDEAEKKAEQEAAMAKMNNELEASAIAPSTELGKGVSVKLKYAPKDHAQVVKILQYWVANVMNTMTVEELTKKLSFMFTAANSGLNKGEVIQGVETIEDIFKRKTK